VLFRYAKSMRHNPMDLHLLTGWGFVRTDYLAGAWWQLFTAQWVHFTFTHAALNVVSLALMLAAFSRLVDARTQWVALLGGVIGVAGVLALDPDCAYYAGASGALHGFLAGNAVGLCMAHSMRWQGAHRIRLLGLALLMGLSVKLWVQHGRADQLPAGDIPTYYPAHEAGAAGGALAVLMYLALRRRKRDVPA